MRRARLAGAAATGLALAVVLGGCTGEPAPQPSEDATEAASPAPSPDASAAPAATVTDGVDPAEMSRQVLDAAEQDAAPVPVLASQTVQAPTGLTADGTAQVTVEVRTVQRRPDSTRVTLAMSAEQEGTELAPDTFGRPRNLNKFDSIALEVPTAGSRMLPLSWRRWISSPDNLALDGPTNDCVCPAWGPELGPEPVLMDVMYGPLPADVTAVSITSPDGLLAITDVPVG